MSEVSMRDVLAFLKNNSEVFSEAITEDGIDVDALESLAVRGDALRVAERKSTFSEDARSEFVDTVFSLAADVEAGIKKSGTSGDRRFSMTTPHGKITVVLSND